MEQEVTNFSQFYLLLGRMPYEGDRKDLKCELVSKVTKGRTESLREVTQKEYDNLITWMESVCDNYYRSVRPALRMHRSTCLHLMQQIGVDTANWDAVNAYCRSPKIAGTEFRKLDIEALYELSKKLRMILKKQSDK